MHIEEFYVGVIIALGAVLTLSGLMFLFVHIPAGEGLDNYRQARRAMAAAYLFFAVVNFIELALQDTDGSINIMVIKMVTISVAFSQAFLFTYTCLRLLNASSASQNLFGIELTPVVVIVAAVFLVFGIFDEPVLNIAVYVFMAVYIGALVYYTWRFTKTYRRFSLRMDNYFSTDEAARLRWVAIAFYMALGVGIWALVATWFTSTLFAILFDLFSIWFYAQFGIRLINYLWQFELLHPAIESPDIEDDTTDDAEDETVLMSDDVMYKTIERRIDRWLAEKKFTEQGLTIDVIAGELGTNRNYLSRHINTHKNKTFRKWINELRIEEAKRLMTSCPTKALDDIAFETGFVDRSNFFRQFAQYTGTTPKAWLAEQGKRAVSTARASSGTP